MNNFLKRSQLSSWDLFFKTYVFYLCF
jgi:hypothetical protein